MPIDVTDGETAFRYRPGSRTFFVADSGIDYMSPRMLGYATVAILSAVQEDARYGLDIMARTDLPSGTVYPTLGRMEKRGFVKGAWESKSVAEREGRPRRRYYEITPAGRVVLAQALREFRNLGVPSRRPSPGEA